jgi:hypothetical protein
MIINHGKKKAAYNRTSAGTDQVFPSSNSTGKIVNSLDDNDNNNK